MKASVPTKEQKLLLGVGLLGVLILWVYSTYMVKPVLRKLSKQSKEIKTASASYKEAKSFLAEEPKLKIEFEKLSAEFETLREAIPSEDDLPKAIETISEIANRAGLKIQSISPQRTVESISTVLKAPAKTSGKTGAKAADKNTKTAPVLYKEIPIQIDSYAGFHQLGDFVSMIETADQPMQVKSLTINSNTKDPRRHNVRITLSAFFRLPSKDEIEAQSGEAKDT